MDGLSPKQHCAISWLVLLLLSLFLVIFVLIPWYQKMAEYGDTIESWEGSLRRFQSKLSERPALEAALNDSQYETKIRTYYLKGNTDALAGAELQQQVKEAIEKTNGQLVSTQLLMSAQSQTKVPRVTVKVRMRGDTNDLMTVLYELESGKPFLFVEEMSARGSKGNASNRKEILDINLTLNGFMSNRQVEP